MNRKKETYDRYAVGERIQKRRQSLGISQDTLAERIDRATKYCSDIERGICGMSVETMLAFSEHLNMSLDYMMFGTGAPEKQSEIYSEASEKKSAKTTPVVPAELQQLMEHCTERQYNYALRLLEVFMEATENYF